MTPNTQQIALVQETLPRITARIGQASMAFEAHLLRHEPTWTGHRSAGRAAQGNALVEAICAGLSGKCRAETAQARLASLAHSFRESGLGPRSYIAINAALMDMIVEHVSDAPGAEEAWAEVIGTILAAMVAEAHGPRRVAMPLAA